MVINKKKATLLRYHPKHDHIQKETKNKKDLGHMPINTHTYTHAHTRTHTHTRTVYT